MSALQDMIDQLERQEFEQWAEAEAGPLLRDEKLGYVYTDVRAAWKAWQAAAKATEARWLAACSTVAEGAEAASRPGVQTVAQIRRLALGHNVRVDLETTR